MNTITHTKMKLTSMGAGRVGAELPITTSEVFRWVCQKQGISKPERLTDARYRSLWTIADRAMDSINRLFADLGAGRDPDGDDAQDWAADEGERLGLTQ